MMTQATIVNSGEDEEARFARERELVRAEFPDCPFEVSVDLDELDEDLGQDEIEVVLNCNCYCWAEAGHRKVSIKVRPTGSNTSVTVREAIRALESVYGPQFECNHRFLEGFDEASPGVYEVFMGS